MCKAWRDVQGSVTLIGGATGSTTVHKDMCLSCTILYFSPLTDLTAVCAS